MKRINVYCDSVIEHFVDADFFTPALDDVWKKEKRKILGLPEDKKIVIWVGKFLPFKYHFIPKLVKEFKDVHFVLVFPDLESRYEPKSDNVTTYSGIHQGQLRILYAVSDAALSIAPVESFNLFSCEAGLANVPLVAFKTGIFWDWWDDKLGMRVENWDYDAFADALAEILGSPERYAPREALQKRLLTKEQWIEKWRALLYPKPIIGNPPVPEYE